MVTLEDRYRWEPIHHVFVLLEDEPDVVDARRQRLDIQAARTALAGNSRSPSPSTRSTPNRASWTSGCAPVLTDYGVRLAGRPRVGRAAVQSQCLLEHDGCRGSRGRAARVIKA